MKNNSGVTLISLAVTIVVLLILAGVSITMVDDDKGIVAKAQEAKKLTLEAQEKEDQELKLIHEFVENSGSVNNIYLALTMISNDSVTQGTPIIFTLSITTNSTIQSQNIVAKIIDSNNDEIGNATVADTTITIDTSSLDVGTYRLKIASGSIVTENGLSSNELISDSFTITKSSGNSTHSGGSN